MKPVPHFTPSVGRQVQYALSAAQASALNSMIEDSAKHADRVRSIAKTLSAVAAKEMFSPEEERQMVLRAGAYKEGDFVSALISRVHEDGACDLLLHGPTGQAFPVANVENAYGPLGYLYFNQVDNAPKPIRDDSGKSAKDAIASDPF